MKTNRIWRCFANLSWSFSLVLFAFVALNANAANEPIYAVDLRNNLLFFYSDNPGNILHSHHISGLQASEEIRGIDYWNGILYGLGSSSRLYTINTNTGQATVVGSQFVPLLDGISFGCDNGTNGFRVVSGGGTTNHQNLLINRATGAVISAGPVFTPGQPHVDALAYNPSTGIWYAGDSIQNTFATLDPATGLLSTIGSAGIDFSRHNGFDISAATGIAYLASGASSSDPASNLFTVSKTTGTASLFGLIGQPGENILIRGLAVASP